MPAPTTRRTPARYTRIAALVGTALLALVATMLVVPPFTMTMLVLVVAVTELSPLLALAALLWLPVSLLLLRGDARRQATAGVVLLLVAGLSLRPLAQHRAVAERAAEQLGGAPSRYSLGATLRGAPNATGIVERTIPYTATDASPLTMRLFRASARGPRPTVVVIHGGAWRSGEPTQGANVSRALAAHGFTVVAIDYRHAPRHPHPASLDDVRRSLALLRDSSTAWGIDTTRIALLGRSAGGHLAELAAFTSVTPGVRAVVAIYAPFDLVRGYEDRPSPDPLDVRAVLRDFLGGTPAERAFGYRDASPSSHIRPGLPPTLLLYGTRDHAVKVSFNRDAAVRLRAAGVRVVQVEVPWAEHGFDLAPGGIGAQLAYDTMVKFLDRELTTSVSEPRAARPRAP